MANFMTKEKHQHLQMEIQQGMIKEANEHVKELEEAARKARDNLPNRLVDIKKSIEETVAKYNIAHNLSMKEGAEMQELDNQKRNAKSRKETQDNKLLKLTKDTIDTHSKFNKKKTT